MGGHLIGRDGQEEILNKEWIFTYDILGKKVINMDTGEIVGSLSKSRVPTVAKINGGKGWVKLLYFPCNLSKTQGAILSYVAQHNRLRKGDNAVVCDNRTVASTKYILEGAGIDSYKTGIKALQELKKRGIMVKSNNTWFLNPYVAYKSHEGGIIKISTLELFEPFRFLHQKERNRNCI